MIELAKSGSAVCTVCHTPIARGTPRFGPLGGVVERWFHLACAAGSQPDAVREAFFEGGDLPAHHEVEAVRRRLMSVTALADELAAAGMDRQQALDSLVAAAQRAAEQALPRRTVEAWFDAFEDDLVVYLLFDVVAEVTTPERQVSLAAVNRELDPGAAVGEQMMLAVHVPSPHDEVFGLGPDDLLELQRLRDGLGKVLAAARDELMPQP
jgi:hypothetical protein